jgi:PBP1b-binding outer membrane lipoprotein LpoB
VKKSLLLIPMLALLLQGCGMTMTRYEPSFENVQKLKQTPAAPRDQQSSGHGRIR